MLITFGYTSNACAANFVPPKLTGHVVDNAHVLPDYLVRTINDRLEAHEAETTNQVVIATVKSLQGLDIETYANTLFRTWALGQKDKNNGVLLVIAPNEHEMRIEVGYGLEGKLTDALASQIIFKIFKPAFKAGDIAGGIDKGSMAILDVLNHGHVATIDVLKLNYVIDADGFVPPILAGTVTDDAHVLTKSSELRIRKKLAHYEAQTSDRIMIVTVKSLQGFDIDTYTDKLFRAWSFDRRFSDTGVFFVIVPKGREMRIKVGTRLKNRLTDAVTAQIINEVVRPKIKPSGIHYAIEQGTYAIIGAAMTGEIPAEEKRYGNENGKLGWDMLLFIVSLIVAKIVRHFIAGDLDEESKSGAKATWVRAGVGVLISIFLFVLFRGRGGSSGGGGASGKL